MVAASDRVFYAALGRVDCVYGRNSAFPVYLYPILRQAMETQNFMNLSQLIQEKKAHVAVVGLGYVGLPLCLEFVSAGFQVIGIDVNGTRVEQLKKGRSYIADVSNAQLQKALSTKRFLPSGDYALLEKVDAISICVPTPLRKTKEPDISFIVSATRKIRKYLRPSQLVILESTTYPGTTEEVVLPELEKSGLKVGKDFYLAFSPERIDPGNKHYTLKNTPKVIGGITSNCMEMASSLYGTIVDKIIPVSSTRLAEMVKLLENTFRAVNIALVNEIALISDRLHLDVWEVIDAAATKPFGFLPFYPGPGLGGHCIPVDPHYLSWKLMTLDYNPRFIELARDINSKMPEVVVDKTAAALNRAKKAINGAKILVLGVSYKKDVGDLRESPALDIIQKLKERGAQIFYQDSYCPKLKAGGAQYESVDLNYDLFSSYDCVAIVTDHSYYDWHQVVSASPVVVDCRNATKFVKHSRDKIIKI